MHEFRLIKSILMQTRRRGSPLVVAWDTCRAWNVQQFSHSPISCRKLHLCHKMLTRSRESGAFCPKCCKWTWWWYCNFILFTLKSLSSFHGWRCISWHGNWLFVPHGAFGARNAFNARKASLWIKKNLLTRIHLMKTSSVTLLNSSNITSIHRYKLMSGMPFLACSFCTQHNVLPSAS